ncbi:hypothetical protein HanPSC8_Chr08g0310911 [Helianthus annuus]|nr:hypothetical protein HanPSC8_Chr08g0310911 [Helianthus annuus]
MLRMVDLEGSFFEVPAYPSKALSPKDDPSDHLSNPSSRPAELGIYIPMHVLSFGRQTQDRKRELSLRAFCPNSHTHLREFIEHFCKH